MENKTQNTQDKRYQIIANKWFDKIGGNTYHSIQITDLSDFKVISVKNMVYGYDEEYKQTAYKELIDLGLVKEEDRFNHDLNGKRFLFVCCDVDRKRDLNFQEVEK